MLRPLLSRFADHCETNPNFFDFPTWYKYINLEHNHDTNRCEVPMGFGITDFPVIALALVDIALRLAALVTVGYVIYGGILYVTSQGEPDKLKKARQTIINALIGLIMALIATGLVAFIGTRIGHN